MAATDAETVRKDGRHIVDLLRTKKDDLTENPWRYSLMNWGHDPLKQ